MDLQPAAPAEAAIQVLLIEVGTEIYGVDATQVIRIDRAEKNAFAHPALGHLHRGNRALVFRTVSGEAQLKVDAVRGVAEVQVEQLRRFPPATTRSPLAVGLYLSDERPIVLIDLPQSL